MKYIVYKNITGYFDLEKRYERTELKNDKELKNYLFDNQHNLKNIEIFTESKKVNININIEIK